MGPWEDGPGGGSSAERPGEVRGGCGPPEAARRRNRLFSCRIVGQPFAFVPPPQECGAAGPRPHALPGGGRRGESGDRPWREKPGSCLSVAHASGNATARAAPHFRPLLPGPLDLVSDAFPWFSRHPGPQSRWLSWGATQGTLSGAVPQPAQVPAMPASAKESGCCISGVPSAFE